MTDENNNNNKNNSKKRARENALIWREYKAPNGKKYYYNVKTKVTTWDKPSEFSEDSKLKKTKINKNQINLFSDWAIVIEKDGHRFIQINTGKIVENLSDEKNLLLMDRIDHDLFGRLCKDSSNSDLFDDFRRNVNCIKELIEQEYRKAEIEEEKEKEDNTGLVSGYVSSSDEEDNTEDTEQDDALISNIDLKIEELKNGTVSDNEKEFLNLLDEINPSPYSAWIHVSKKLIDDPVFKSIRNHDTRSDLFDFWCRKQIDLNTESQLSTNENQNTSPGPSPYYCLSKIISSYPMAPTTIFRDIKDAKKQEFKKYKIKKNLNKNEQDIFASKLIFFLKKLEFQDRLKLWQESVDQYKDDLKLRPFPKFSEDTLEQQLLSFEYSTNITSSSLISDPRYHCLSLVEKSRAWSGLNNECD